MNIGDREKLTGLVILPFLLARSGHPQSRGVQTDERKNVRRQPQRRIRPELSKF